MVEVLDSRYGLIRNPNLVELESQEAVDQLFKEMVGTHFNDHDKFDYLDPESSTEPDKIREIQAIDTIASRGKSATTKELVDFGRIIIPEIEQYIEIMLDRKDLVTHLKDRLDQGDLVIATNHRDVIGVALALGMTSVCLQENGVRADEFETDLAVSAMLKYVKTNNLPAVPAMQGLFSNVRFVIPAGNKEVRKRLDPEYVGEFNTQSNLLMQTTNEVPTIRGVAPSGTRDYHTPWKFPTDVKKFAREWQMMRPSPNTINLYFNGPVLGISLDLSEPPKSGVYISGLHLPEKDMDLSTRSELIMTDLAEAKGKPKLRSVLIDPEEKK